MTAEAENTEAWARRVLQAANLPDTGSIVRMSGGIANHVYRVGTDYVVRLGTGSDGICFPKSTEILRAVDGTMCAPRVLHADFSQQVVPCNVMICSYLPGALLAEQWGSYSNDAKRSIAAEVADELHVLYKVPWKGMAAFPDQPPWPERAWSRFEQYLQIAYEKADFPASRLDRMRDSGGQWRDSLDHAGPDVLLHNDMHWGNVLVDDGHVTGVLDFDDAEVGPAELELWRWIGYLVEQGWPAPDVVSFVADAFPGELDRPGCVQRCKFDLLSEILWSLTQAEGLTWTTVEEELQEADEGYRRLFESDYYDNWFAGFDTAR